MTEILSRAHRDESQARGRVPVWVPPSSVRVCSPGLLAAPGAVVPGAPADFDAGESSSSEGEIVSWQWDFGDGGELGDGGEVSGPRVSHVLREPGGYRVRVTVATAAESCRTATAESWVTVNAPPAAVAGEDRLAAVSELLAFSAAASEDPNGSLVAYEWDFDDGATASGVEVWHRYERSGRFPVTLEVRDDAGLANSRSRDTLEVTVNLDGSASTDPDGTISAYRWDLGDGTSASGARVTHAYGESGRYAVTLEVEDDSATSCAVASASTSVLVNASPVARIRVPDGRLFAGGAHDEVAFDATASSDPDGDSLTYHWDFGDGSSGRGARVRHAYVKPGTYTVALTVRDGSGLPCGEASAELSLEIASR